MKLSLKKLMILFAFATSGIILIATFYYMFSSLMDFRTQKEQIQNNAISRVSTELQKNIQTTNNISDYISENSGRVENIQKYLDSSEAGYAQYILKQSDKTGTYFNWPNASRDFFMKNSGLSELEVRLLDSRNIFRATSRQSTGKVIKHPHIKKTNMISSVVINPQYQKLVGIVLAKYDNTSLYRSLRKLNSNEMHMQVIALTSDNRLLLHYADKSVSPIEKNYVSQRLLNKNQTKISGYEVKTTDLDQQQYKVIVLFNNNQLIWLLIKRFCWIVAIAVIVLVALFISFIAIFNRYREQLNTIILTTQAVSDNDLDARIDTNDTRFEDLATLSHSINHMLDEINNNINTIYKLRIAQQEAHMKSLQAQISPHFMANTLEYIRMSALDMGARDLAKVIYNFAALLRSNVGSEVQSTLKKETKIVGNYIYLYQVRFPDKLAYQITIPDELESVKLPKFSLQPLVENYFVHGVDFTRGTNAIEVKARLENNRVVITVADNGKTMTDEDLQQLNAKLKQPIVGDKSIGLQNVYARMKNYTKNFAMEIKNNSYGGITVELSFDYEI